MELIDVYNMPQLKQYYKEKNLSKTCEKIANLTTTMGILGTRCERTETDEENLMGLEELALLGSWRIS